MSWTDKLWTAYSAVKNVTLDMTANAMEVVGTIACAVGGVGYVLSLVLDETIKISYYGAGEAEGDINLQAGIKDIGYSNDTISFQFDAKKSGTLSYNVQEFLSPSTVLYYSMVLVTSGTSLRLLGANLKHYQESYNDRSNYKVKHKVDLPRPSYTEYLYVCGQSLTGSFSLMSLSTALSATILDWSKYIGSQQSVTYPSSAPVVNGTDPEEPVLANTTEYQGPLYYSEVPLYSNFSELVTFDILGIRIKVSARELVSGNVGVAYGVGAFFQSNTTSSTLRPSILVSTPLGVGSFLAYRFFGNKVKELRDERLIQAVDSKNDLYIAAGG